MQLLHGIIGAGQSLAMGAQAPLNHSTEEIPHAYKLYDDHEPWSERYDINNPSSPSLQLVPLTEPLKEKHQFSAGYPWNVAGLTPHSGMAAELASRGYETVHTCVAKGGEPLRRISKNGGTNSYEAAVFEVAAIRRMAKTKFDLILTHGESDAMVANRTYKAELLTFFNDHVEDMEIEWMILSQQSTMPASPATGICNPVTQAQWLTGHERIVCAGPKYQYGYADGLHLPGPGYTRLGEKYAQVLDAVRNRNFAPLSPKSIKIDGNCVVIEFHVPVSPLRWDDHLHAPHRLNYQSWRAGRGFEVRRSNWQPIEIVDVAIDGNCVQIRLAEQCCPVIVAYAMTADAWGVCGGREGGRIGMFLPLLTGHLCDSDEMVGASAEMIKFDAVHGQSMIKSLSFANRAMFDLLDEHTIVGLSAGVAVLDRYVLSC